jgi:tetratricopeptide (TPR) repeat protein
MDALLPQAYLLGLIVLLGAAAVAVTRQILRVRSDELELIRLERDVSADCRDAGALYALAAVQLRKRLHSQATASLRRATRCMGSEPAEAKAIIENALGFSLAAQKQFEAACRHYQAALRHRSDYPIALNNLAFAYEKLARGEQARDCYEKVLAQEPGNRTAQRRLRRLTRRSPFAATGSSGSGPSSPETPDGGGGF